MYKISSTIEFSNVNESAVAAAVIVDLVYYLRYFPHSKIFTIYVDISYLRKGVIIDTTNQHYFNMHF